MQQARRLGAMDQALALAQQAKQLLDTTQASPVRRFELLLEVSRTLFFGAGSVPGADLVAAAQVLQEAEVLLPELSPRARADYHSLPQGALDAAVNQLDRALEAQAKTRDAVGLAKTAAAIAEALRQDEQYDAALKYIERSVRYNTASASSIGLQYNRNWFEQFVWALPHRARGELEQPIRALAGLLNVSQDEEPQAQRSLV